jgi:hypothetical protein
MPVAGAPLLSEPAAPQVQTSWGQRPSCLPAPVCCPSRSRSYGGTTRARATSCPGDGQDKGDRRGEGRGSRHARRKRTTEHRTGQPGRPSKQTGRGAWWSGCRWLGYGGGQGQAAPRLQPRVLARWGRCRSTTEAEFAIRNSRGTLTVRLFCRREMARPQLRGRQPSTNRSSRSTTRCSTLSRRYRVPAKTLTRAPAAHRDRVLLSGRPFTCPNKRPRKCHPWASGARCRCRS